MHGNDGEGTTQGVGSTCFLGISYDLCLLFSNLALQVRTKPSIQTCLCKDLQPTVACTALAMEVMTLPLVRAVA